MNIFHKFSLKATIDAKALFQLLLLNRNGYLHRSTAHKSVSLEFYSMFYTKKLRLFILRLFSNCIARFANRNKKKENAVNDQQSRTGS